METRSRIGLLGGLRLEQGNRVITRFRTQKTAALLAYLAYFRERFHPREHLIDLLWPEADLASGRNSLSIALSSLRHQLEPPGVPHGAILRADRSSVQLNPAAVDTDVAAFELALQKAAQAGSTNERILFLTQAVELYGGELLPGCYEEWCLTERERLAGSYLRALHPLVVSLEQTGDLDRALGYARRAVSADPLLEEGHQHVMRLLAAAGQPAAALRQYRELEQLLEEQLGEAPSLLTRQLAREIERHTTTGRAAAKPVDKVTAPRSRRPSALPARLPTGTVTFLLTDLESSTVSWEKGGERFTTALASHHTLLRRTFHRFGGYEVKETGDGFLVAFQRAGDALACAVAGQRALAEHPWPDAVGALRVRMALHTGDVEVQDGDYHGLVLHHASRMLAAGHGGQILCSEATAGVVQRNLEAGIRLTDLGVYRLRDLEAPERLFQVEDAPSGLRVFPPLRAEAGYARNLPLQFTRFVGREKELEQLEELLITADIRLLTLTGPGGTGKSRLALELAGRLVEHFRGAVWFVPLADLSDSHTIVDAVREVLRLPRTASAEPLEQVLEMLSRQPSLLVLDNFEHLVEDGGAVVQKLLERAPSLKCLVTSRRRLDVSAEREFGVPPLQTPEGTHTAEHLSAYESVRLFIDRAQAVKTDFQMTNRNAAAVAELCSRLEGIPLAIELAAARVQVLTPAQMLHQLSRRFEFLVSRRRDGVKRHQTLHAAIEWSYRLLSPELQRFFAHLSVFRGGWTLEAAEAVCLASAGLEWNRGEALDDQQSKTSERVSQPLTPSSPHPPATAPPDTLDYLAQLQECSLVLAEEGVQGMRFRMLETLREFAAERVQASGEMEALHQQHAEFYFSMLEEAAPDLLGWHPEGWIERLETEHANLLSALDWRLRPDATDLGKVFPAAEAIYPFWIWRCHFAEGRRRLEALLAHPAASLPAPERAMMLQFAANLASELGDHTAKRAFLEERLDLWRERDDPWEIAMALSQRGIAASEQGDHATARRCWEEGLRLCQEQNWHGIQGFILCLLAGLSYRSGEHATAYSLWEESLAELRQITDQAGRSERLCDLGLTAFEWGDHDRARRLIEEALFISREIGDEGNTAAYLYWLANVVLAQGDPAAARELCTESLSHFRQLRNLPWSSRVLETLAVIAVEQAQPERAARLFAALGAHRQALGAPPVAYRHLECRQRVEAARAVAGGRELAAAWTEGRAMTLEQAISDALEE